MKHYTASLNRIWKGFPLWLRVIAASVFIIIVIWAAIPGDSPDLPGTNAQHGEFVVDLKESGRLKAENSVTITAPPVRMNLQIVFLVEEGTVVESGDVIVQFDSTELKKMIDDSQAELDIARANLTRNKASMASQMANLKSAVENSQASFRLATLRLEQMKFEADVRIEEGKLNLKQAEISLNRSLEQVEAQREIDSADLMSLEIKIKQAELDLEKTYRDLSRLTIRAPSPGLVVYKETWKGGEMSKVQVGDTPWRGMALVELPDLSVMMVKTAVSEVDVSKLKLGQEVEVKLDAYPDPTFIGDVADIAALARDSDGNSEAKVFDVLIRIRDSDPILRPGMSTTERIIIDRLPDKTWVPIEAVFDRGGKMIVWVEDGYSWRDVEVDIGARNDNFVVIESGVQPGMRVLLVDPTISEDAELSSISSEQSSENIGNVKQNNSKPRQSSRRRGH